MLSIERVEHILPRILSVGSCTTVPYSKFLNLIASGDVRSCWVSEMTQNLTATIRLVF
jgi:hypothetical protein